MKPPPFHSVIPEGTKALDRLLGGLLKVIVVDVQMTLGLPEDVAGRIEVFARLDESRANRIAPAFLP